MLETVTSFKYMGRALMAKYDDCLAVSGNPRRDRNIWLRMTRILSREGADLKVLGIFFKAVVQAVLIFGAEMWVLTPRMERALSSFKTRFVQRITGRQMRLQGERSW